MRRLNAVAPLFVSSIVVCSAFLCSGCRRPEPPAPKPTPAVDTASAATGSADAGLGGLETIQAADLKHVDPLDLLAQARRIATNRDPHAVLVEIAARDDVSAGTVDVTGRGITYEFEWYYFDKSQPPGKDTVDNKLEVFARGGRFSVREQGHAFTIRDRTPPGQTPRCSGRNAWKAAVRSGMPENAVASIRYDAVRQTWTFHVDGHPELKRVVNDATCTVGTVGKPGGQPRPSAFPGAPPPTGALPF